MAKPQRFCIFCGGTGLTKEHVLPDWLRAIFPRLPTDTHTSGSFEWPSLPTAGHVALPQMIQVKQGQAGTKKVRAVCKQCNNGWLGRMEEGVKPLLGDLVCGYQRAIDVEVQRQLASRIAKTTMTAEFLKPNDVSITQAERDQFRRSLEPPSHWQIWIGFYVGLKQMLGRIFHHGVGIYLPPRPIRIGVKNTQYTVVGLGRLIAISLSSEEDGLSFTMNQELDVAIKRLWPPGGQDIWWPPQRSVGDFTADAIIRAFGDALGLRVASL